MSLSLLLSSVLVPAHTESRADDLLPLLDALKGDEAAAEKASQKLAALGETALPALRRLLESPDEKVRSRAREVVREIEVRRELALIEKGGAGKFVRRMVTEKDFPSEERWLAAYRLAGKAVARANELSGRKYALPKLDVARMKTSRNLPQDDTGCQRQRCLVDDPKVGVNSVYECVVLCHGGLPALTGLGDSVVFVNGDFDSATSITNSVVVLSGGMGRVTGIYDSVVLTGKDLEGFTEAKGSFFQVPGVRRCNGSTENTYLDLPKLPTKKGRSRGDLFVEKKAGPRDLFRLDAGDEPKKK